MKLDFLKSKKQLRKTEIDFHRTKVAYLSEAVLENPNNTFRQLELKRSLEQLDRLLTA